LKKDINSANSCHS